MTAKGTDDTEQIWNDAHYFPLLAFLPRNDGYVQVGVQLPLISRHADEKGTPYSIRLIFYKTMPNVDVGRQ